tara:strand:- start:331 stop:1002 length:672 start_codon:yes stop_codon:yes gene_type:complete
MNVFKFLFVCTVLLSCSKPKLGEIGNYQVALGNVKADFHVLMWEQNFSLKKSKIYTSYSNGALHTTRGVLSGKALHGNYKEISLSGALLKIGSFKKGLKDGYWAFYNEDGSLINDLTYSTGDTVSVVKFYNEDGSIKDKVLSLKMKNKLDKIAEQKLKRTACKAKCKSKKEACGAKNNKNLKVENKGVKPVEKNNKFNLCKFKFKKNKKDSVSHKLKVSSPEE